MHNSSSTHSTERIAFSIWCLRHRFAPGNYIQMPYSCVLRSDSVCERERFGNRRTHYTGEITTGNVQKVHAPLG